MRSRERPGQDNRPEEIGPQDIGDKSKIDFESLAAQGEIVELGSENIFDF